MSNEPKSSLLQRPLVTMTRAATPPVVAPEPAMARKPAAPVTVALTERKAFSVERCPGGWRFVTVTYTDDGRLIGVERSEPDIKPIILERFKITSLRYWTSF